MYKIGDKVICEVPCGRELILEKEYTVIDVIKELSKIIVINEYGEKKDYIFIRFRKVDD